MVVSGSGRCQVTGEVVVNSYTIVERGQGLNCVVWEGGRMMSFQGWLGAVEGRPACGQCTTSDGERVTDDGVGGWYEDSKERRL